MFFLEQNQPAVEPGQFVNSRRRCRLKRVTRRRGRSSTRRRTTASDRRRREVFQPARSLRRRYRSHSAWRFGLLLRNQSPPPTRSSGRTDCATEPRCFRRHRMWLRSWSLVLRANSNHMQPAIQSPNSRANRATPGVTSRCDFPARKLETRGGQSMGVLPAETLPSRKRSGGDDRWTNWFKRFVGYHRRGLARPKTRQTMVISENGG